MKKLILAVLVILMLISAFFLVHTLFIEYQHRQMAYEIFCENLDGNMNEKEVIVILNSFGKIKSTKPMDNTSFYRIYVSFENTNLVGNKTYSLHFIDGYYSGTFFPFYSDFSENICIK